MVFRLITILLLGICPAAVAQEVRGKVRVLPDPPASVELGRLSGGGVSVFRERAGQDLQAPLRVDVTAPGTYEGGSREAQVIPAGTHVATWFVHLEGKDWDGADLRGPDHLRAARARLDPER